MEDFDAIRRGYPISITKPKNEHCTARTLTKAILSAFPPHSLQWTTHLSHLIGAYFGARQEEATDWFHWKHEAFLVIVQPLRWLTKQTWVSVTCLEGFMCFAPEKHAHPSPNSSVSGWLRLQRAPIKLATQLYKQTSKGDRSWGKESGFVTLQGEIESQSLPERLLPKENPLQFLPLAELTFPSSGPKRSSRVGVRLHLQESSNVLRWALALRSHYLETAMLPGPTDLGLLPAEAKLQAGKSPIPSVA